jgi:hypothetical protein
MNIKTMEVLVLAGYDLAINISKRESYSGRGMFDRSTHAVIVDKITDLLPVVAYAVTSIEEDEIDKFISDLKNVKVDNMGKEFIFY